MPVQPVLSSSPALSRPSSPSAKKKKSIQLVNKNRKSFSKEKSNHSFKEETDHDEDSSASEMSMLAFKTSVNRKFASFTHQSSTPVSSPTSSRRTSSQINHNGNNNNAKNKIKLNNTNSNRTNADNNNTNTHLNSKQRSQSQQEDTVFSRPNVHMTNSSPSFAPYKESSLASDRPQSLPGPQSVPTLVISTPSAEIFVNDLKNVSRTASLTGKDGKRPNRDKHNSVASCSSLEEARSSNHYTNSISSSNSLEEARSSNHYTNSISNSNSNKNNNKKENDTNNSRSSSYNPKNKIRYRRSLIKTSSGLDLQLKKSTSASSIEYRRSFSSLSNPSPGVNEMRKCSSTTNVLYQGSGGGGALE
eukprot:Awhi_evm1s6826